MKAASSSEILTYISQTTGSRIPNGIIVRSQNNENLKFQISMQNPLSAARNMVIELKVFIHLATISFCLLRACKT
jgi:hypothetical protein